MTNDDAAPADPPGETAERVGVDVQIDHTKVHKNFSIKVTTMAKLTRLADATGIPKEKLALMVMRAQRKGLI